MEQCECYRSYSYEYCAGYCNGTKNCEPCTCGGDKTKCDFYDYIRKEAKRMNTLEMMNEAEKTGRTYVSNDMKYNTKYGFHDESNSPWDGYAFTYLNDLFASDIRWDVVENDKNTMTKSEAEAKFNIKIVG